MTSTETTDMAQLLAELQAHAVEAADPDGPPPTIVAGTFALYPDGNGGIMMVMDVRDGVIPAGTHRMPIPQGMIRAIGVLAGGGGKLAALRALAGGRRGRN